MQYRSLSSLILVLFFCTPVFGAKRNKCVRSAADTYSVSEVVEMTPGRAAREAKKFFTAAREGIELSPVGRMILEKANRLTAAELKQDTIYLTRSLINRVQKSIDPTIRDSTPRVRVNSPRLTHIDTKKISFALDENHVKARHLIDRGEIENLYNLVRAGDKDAVAAWYAKNQSSPQHRRWFERDQNTFFGQGELWRAYRDVKLGEVISPPKPFAGSPNTYYYQVERKRRDGSVYRHRVTIEFDGQETGKIVQLIPLCGPDVYEAVKLSEIEGWAKGRSNQVPVRHRPCR